MPRYSIDSGGADCTWAIGLDRANDVGDRHLVGLAGEPVAALGATASAHDAGVLELQEDVLEELQRDVLGLGEFLALDRIVVGGGELGSRPHRIVSLG